MKKYCNQTTSGSEARLKGNKVAQTILNSISAHVAILDQRGFILETNRAWKRFAEENQLQMRPDTLGINYLEICDRAGGPDPTEPSVVANGIRDVISGKCREFVMDYPCDAPDKKRWFYMRVTRATGSGPLCIVVSHEDITALKLAEERRRQSEEALLREKRKLEETNTALKVLLRQREADQLEMETIVLENMRQIVAPLMARLHKQRLSPLTESLLKKLEEQLYQITNPFLKNMSAIESALSPREIEVAVLIREGLTSKEIADQVNLSLTTVNFHRRNLRRKLNIRNTDTNLRTFLSSLAK